MRYCCCCWKSFKGRLGGRWGEMFFCFGVRGCFCFLVLFYVVFVVRRNCVCFLDKGVLCGVVVVIKVY